ncbi:MAG: hypothetical protein KJS64_03615 [Acidobacteria bacterium]|nr:hypothetical protein [Acidobacteriota bacterium]
MKLIKALLGLVLVTACAAVAALVLTGLKRDETSSRITFDEWPDVPRKPDAVVAGA